MVFERNSIKEYPFMGTFTDVRYDGEEDKDIEEVVLETPCDIQRTAITDGSGVMQSTYVVYFPFDKEEGITIRRGMRFSGNMYGLNVCGTINEPFPTQMGGCEVTLKDLYA